MRQWALPQRAMPDRPTGPIPSATDGSDRLVKVKEAAQILGVSTSTIYKLMTDGTLKKHALTRHIARSELDRLIREQLKAR
jgi:excisionase family DNA binding protein